LPVEEIKAALEASERAAQLQEYEAAEAAAGNGGDSGKVYDLTDVED
jgi:hypothetical protein